MGEELHNISKQKSSAEYVVEAATIVRRLTTANGSDLDNEEAVPLPGEKTPEEDLERLVLELVWKLLF